MQNKTYFFFQLRRLVFWLSDVGNDSVSFEFHVKTWNLTNTCFPLQLPVLSAGTDRRTSRIPKMTPVHLDLPFSSSFTRGGELSWLGL